MQPENERTIQLEKQGTHATQTELLAQTPMRFLLQMEFERASKTVKQMQNAISLEIEKLMKRRGG